ncbi:MAG: hypothetical protein Udaeo2_21340 [Candidatus Udaeobacter sp.]|nr:MAG: hypothetical protein Udaeo2_21340 [Candidatus Udaeobacter sp.]
MSKNEAHPFRLRRCGRRRQRHQAFVSLFTPDGVILDVASGTEYRGKDLGRMVDVFTTAFPDMHRDIHHVYEASDR